MSPFLLLSALLLGAGDKPAIPAAAFEFVDADHFEGRSVAQYRAIEFRDKPARPLSADFKAEPGMLYGLVPVGPRPETALMIVWCPKAAGGPVLWLDADGDGRFSPGERHLMPGRTLEVPATITVQLEPTRNQVKRTLLFRRSALGDGLRYAVRGFARGTLSLGKTRHAALLIDGNADGCFDTVGQDRVWIDLDGDGHFDPFTEQFLLGKPITKDGEVYLVRSDPLAAAVQVNQRSADRGKLRLELAVKPDRPAKVSAELVSDLGELVSIDKLGEAADVPVGKYSLSWLKLEMTDSASQSWTYSFYRDKGKDYEVRSGRETPVSLMAGLVLKVEMDTERYGRTPAPGDTVVVSPRLVADGSLYLSSCTIGKGETASSAEASAEIALLSLEGKIISRGITGFS
jgi:hypothetical protein